MAIITILSGSYCHGDEVLSLLSERLGYRHINHDLFAQTSQQFQISEDKLDQALHGTGPYGSPTSKDRLKIMACLEVTLSELIQQDNIILRGCAGFLIPGNIAHVLRVCLAADPRYRVAEAMKTSQLDESAISEEIREYDQSVTACSMNIVSHSAYDENLYDIVLPMDRHSVDEAVQSIADHAQSEAIRTTEWSQSKAKDYLLGARVKRVLTESGHAVEVFSEAGNVTVGINEHAFLMGRLQEKLKSLALEVDGVSAVTTKLGSKFSPPSTNPWENIDAPPKFLLVDDEKEFVDTLSERLKSRNLESSIAYDGEQALALVETEVPDVIVLDLLMPGIDGIETLRRVKQSHPEVEVIILTGHGSDREQSAAEELGAFAYLHKPVNVNELAQIMRQAYSRRHK